MEWSVDKQYKYTQPSPSSKWIDIYCELTWAVDKQPTGGLGIDKNNKIKGICLQQSIYAWLCGPNLCCFISTQVLRLALRKQISPPRDRKSVSNKFAVENIFLGNGME